MSLSLFSFLGFVSHCKILIVFRAFVYELVMNVLKADVINACNSFEVNSISNF